EKVSWHPLQHGRCHAISLENSWNSRRCVAHGGARSCTTITSSVRGSAGDDDALAPALVLLDVAIGALFRRKAEGREELLLVPRQLVELRREVRFAEINLFAPLLLVLHFERQLVGIGASL